MQKVQFIVKQRYIHLAHRIGFDIFSPTWFAYCQVITISAKRHRSTVKMKEAEQRKTTNQAQNAVELCRGNCSNLLLSCRKAHRNLFAEGHWRSLCKNTSTSLCKSLLLLSRCEQRAILNLFCSY